MSEVNLAAIQGNNCTLPKENLAECKDIGNYIELVKAILDCRRKDQFLIAGLCEKGRNVLNEFVLHGESFMTFLGTVESQTKTEIYEGDDIDIVDQTKRDIHYFLNKNLREIDKGSLNRNSNQSHSCEKFSSSISGKYNKNIENDRVSLSQNSNSRKTKEDILKRNGKVSKILQLQILPSEEYLKEFPRGLSCDYDSSLNPKGGVRCSADAFTQTESCPDLTYVENLQRDDNEPTSSIVKIEESWASSIERTNGIQTNYINHNSITSEGVEESLVLIGEDDCKTLSTENHFEENGIMDDSCPTQFSVEPEKQMALKHKDEESIVDIEEEDCRTLIPENHCDSSKIIDQLRLNDEVQSDGGLQEHPVTCEEPEGTETLEMAQTLLKMIPSLQKSYKELNSQLNKYKTACTSRSMQQSSSHSYLSQSQYQCSHNGHPLPGDVIDLQEKVSDLQNKNGKLEVELKELRDVQVKATRENQQLTHRLSEEMSTKVSSDESNLENIGIVNRPMNVAAEYTRLCTETWLDAKNTLDVYFADYHDEIKLKFLCDIIMVSEREAAKLYEEFMKKLTYLLNHPLELHMEVTGNTEDDVHSPISSVVLNTLSDFERNAAEKVNIKYLVQAIKQYLQGNPTKSGKVGFCGDDMFVTACNVDEIHQYMEQCGRIAWKMVIQRPHMYFDNNTGVQQAWQCSHQDVYYSCEDPGDPRSVVDFYVQPVLRHSGKVMVKGRVFVKRKDN